MTTATRTTPPGPVRQDGATGVATDIVVGGLLTAAAATGSSWLLGLPTSHLLLALTLYGVLAAVVLRGHSGDVAGRGLGAANRITLGRSTLVMALVALTLWPAELAPRGYWWILGLATVAMALDGVDGQVARRTRSESAFGARFDMEVDQLLLLALSALAWRGGKVGVWVLLIGAIRYLFVLAGWIWPAMQRPLPPSFRRKTVCVVQGVALVASVAPIVSAPQATAASAAALLLLIYSFAVDTWWLIRVPLRAPVQATP
jgi:phosphatidylglycerophosphate synthase